MAQVTATVDFGTSHTVAVVSGPDLPARLVTVDGRPWFSSAVFWTRQGTAVAGADALRLAHAEPARLEPRPKTRISDPEVLLGDTVVPTTALVRAVLAGVVDQAAVTAGAPVQHLVLTHPANWGSTRIGALLTAAQGLAPRLSTMSEPVAAATWFARTHEFPVGASIGVLDFGAGTCDAAVVRREAAGLSVTGCAGLPDLGGDDLDQRIVDRIRADEPALAGLLDAQQRSRPADMAALLRLRDDVRAAKEVLSRHPQVDIAMPDGLPDRLLTRPEFERVVSADLARAVGLLTDVVTGCGLRPEDLHAVHVVGGAGQIPLLGAMLGAVFGGKVRLDETPQSVVALGGHTFTAADAGKAPETDRIEPVTEQPHSVDPPQHVPPARRWGWVAAAVAVVAVVGLVVALRGDRTVAGEAHAAVTGEQLTVPPPAGGEPITVPGRSTQHLPVVAKGTPVDYAVDGDRTATWQLDALLDSPQQSAQLAEAGVSTDDAHRLLLARITVGSRAGSIDPEIVAAMTYVVDDRGLMIGAAENFRMVGCPERSTSVSVEPGKPRQLCLAYRVGRTTPVTEVAFAAISTRSPDAFGPELLEIGARVVVTGQPVDGKAQPLPAGTLPLHTAHTFHAQHWSADVAVTDLVQQPSAYFHREPIGLPGSRAVVVRLAVRVSPGSQITPSLHVRLHDDRGTVIESSMDDVTGQGCTPAAELHSGAGVQLYCVLFAVPTATPLRDVQVSAYDEDPTRWVTA